MHQASAGLQQLSQHHGGNRIRLVAGGQAHRHRFGDLGRVEDGYVYLDARREDLIITGGENVYSREVEEVLYTHPSVSEAAVVGDGCVVAAGVVVHPDAGHDLPLDDPEG